MRKLIMAAAVATLATGTFACGHHDTRTVRRTVTTETVPAAPVVVERRTIVEPAPIPEQRIIQQERKTVIEHE